MSNKSQNFNLHLTKILIKFRIVKNVQHANNSHMMHVNQTVSHIVVVQGFSCHNYQLPNYNLSVVCIGHHEKILD